MEYPPYKQSINGNILLYKQSIKWEYPPYKQSINGNIHPINNQSMEISTL